MKLDAYGHIRKALRIAREHGSAQSAREKAWVIDQMVRALVGEREYEDWVRTRGGAWDTGVAPANGGGA